MEERNVKALVLQTDKDTALLLCQGFKILRMKNTAVWEVGEEIEVSAFKFNCIEQKLRRTQLIQSFIKRVACFLILLTGIVASKTVPVHSSELMDYIVVKTNIYGNVIEAEGINEIGEKIIQVIESEENSGKYDVDSIPDYMDRIKKVLAEMEEKSPLSELTASKAFADYYDHVDDELKQKVEDALLTKDTDTLEELKQDVKEDMVRDLYEIPDEELELAKELFDYEKVRTEYYSVGNADHDKIKSNIEHAADIYPPFWSINMEKNDWQPPDTIGLSFSYGAKYTIPDFMDSTVYLYDLTSNKEITSSVKDSISGAPEDINGNELPGGYTKLFVDCSLMTAYHTYYIKINSVHIEGEDIDNIYYVFDYVPEGSIGFAYGEK